MKQYSEFQRFNVFRRPDWRFERILKMVDRYPSPGRCTRRDDEYIRKARNFILRWRAKESDEEREELFNEEPGLFYAYQIYEKTEDDPEPSQFIQARLLARQDYEGIAKCLSTRPETIDWYERLFFNVSDRLDNRDWIVKHVLLPSIMRHHGVAQVPDDSDTPALMFRDSTVAKPFLDSSLKMFAYFGGVHVVDIMIGGFQAGRPLHSQEDMSAWFDHHWSMTIRRRSHMAAMQFEVNKFNVTDLFAIHARIMEIEKSEDTMEHKRTTVERHISKMMEDLPWAVGDDGEKMHAGSMLGTFDVEAAELRDDELLKVARGEKPDGLDEEIFPTKLPPPRMKKPSLDDKKPNL